MKTEATVTVPYKDYEALINELTRLKTYEGMKLIELTVNGHVGPTNLSVITGTVVHDGETTELNKEYPRGYLVYPAYRVIISEIVKMENTVVLIDSNIRKVMQGIQTLSTQHDDISLHIRRIASVNNLILLTKQEKGTAP